MQDFFRFNGIVTIQPDTYSANLATTSTEDSDRDMALVMHNTPIGTVASYDMGWKYIQPLHAAQILAEILNKSSFSLHYFDILSGTWRDGEFYASNFNSPCKTLEEGVECWDELSFTVVGVNPR